MFICGALLQCADNYNRLESGPVKVDDLTTVEHSYKLLI